MSDVLFLHYIDSSPRHHRDIRDIITCQSLSFKQVHRSAEKRHDSLQFLKQDTSPVGRPREPLPPRQANAHISRMQTKLLSSPPAMTLFAGAVWLSDAPLSRRNPR